MSDRAVVTAELRRLEGGATPGPWRTGTERGQTDGIWSDTPTGYDNEEREQTYLVAWCHGDWRADADAAFITAARNQILALLDVVDAARDLADRSPTVEDPEGLGEWCHFCDKQTEGHQGWCDWAALQAALDRLVGTKEATG